MSCDHNVAVTTSVHFKTGYINSQNSKRNERVPEDLVVVLECAELVCKWLCHYAPHPHFTVCRLNTSSNNSESSLDML